MMSIVRLAYASATTLSYTCYVTPPQISKVPYNKRNLMDIMVTHIMVSRSGGLDFSIRFDLDA